MNNDNKGFKDDLKRVYMQNVLEQKIKDYENIHGVKPSKIQIKFIALKKIKNAHIVVMYFKQNLGFIMPTNCKKCRIDRNNCIIHVSTDFSFLLRSVDKQVSNDKQTIEYEH
jgi:hypothetical protein